MNTKSRTITGILMVVLGIVLIIIPFVFLKVELFFLWIYGIPILIIGVFVLFNKKEDKIEERVDLKGVLNRHPKEDNKEARR